jgi:hypothetical protein
MSETSTDSLAELLSPLSSAGLVAVPVAALVAYFAFVVPHELAVLLVWSAAGFAFAGCLPVLVVPSATRLVE